jgi:hypothetical protein
MPHSDQLSGIRAAASMLVVEAGADPDENFPGTVYDDLEGVYIDDDDDDDETPLEVSHGGGEHADKARVVFEYIVAPKCVVVHSIIKLGCLLSNFFRRAVRRRTAIMMHRKARLEALEENWEKQMPELVQAYLQWRHGAHSAPSEDEMEDSSVFEVTAIKTFCEYLTSTFFCLH